MTMADLPEAFYVSIIHAEPDTTIQLGGEVDLATAGPLQDRLELVTDATTGDVTVDLTNVTFLDSTGLAALLAASRRMQRDGRRLTLVNPCAAVHRVLQISGVVKLLEVRSTPESALD
jgi:anti-sigma B factor antagonist